MTAPRPAARRAVLLATRLLPAGAVRHRYREEILAELHELKPSDQLRHAAGVLSQAWALRRAITQAPAGTAGLDGHPGSAAPLHCRLHLFHHYRLAFTDDGHRYQRCRDCGRDHPSFGHGGPFDPIGLGMSGPH